MIELRPFCTTYTQQEGVPSGLARPQRCLPPAQEQFPSPKGQQQSDSSLGVWHEPSSLPKHKQNCALSKFCSPSSVPHVARKPKVRGNVIPLYPLQVCTSVVPVRARHTPKSKSFERAGPWVARIGGLPLKHVSRSEVISLGHLTARTSPRPSPPRYTEYLQGTARTMDRYDQCLKQ